MWAALQYARLFLPLPSRGAELSTLQPLFPSFLPPTYPGGFGAPILGAFGLESGRRGGGGALSLVFWGGGRGWMLLGSVLLFLLCYQVSNPASEPKGREERGKEIRPLLPAPTACALADEAGDATPSPNARALTNGGVSEI